MKKKVEKKPIMRASHIGLDLGNGVWKIISYTLMVAFLSLILGTVATDGSLLGRILSVVIALSFVLLEGMEGASRAERNVTTSHMLTTRMKDNGYSPTNKELSTCYAPSKAILAALIAAAVPFALAVIVAINAKPYTYTMQDLPNWLTSYANREDVMGALVPYTNIGSAAAVDYIRIAVRVFILPFVSLFSAIEENAFMIDRLSPLLTLIMPTAYALGYLAGPSLYEKRMAQNEQAKKAKLKKIKRNKKKARKNLAQQQQTREKKRKDNQLI